MGLILKAGIKVDLIKTATLAFSSIGVLILLINYLPFLKTVFPNYTFKLGGLIGNTSFLGIPIASALINAEFLPNEAINLSVGFDLGTTLFAWIFGPFFLQEKITKNNSIDLIKLLTKLLSSPALKGIIGVLIAYLLGLEKYIGNILSIPTEIVIYLALLVVGSRLGIITNSKREISGFNNPIKSSILLKLLIFPLIIFFVSKLLNFDSYQTTATVIQAGTPSAISTILMAEAYKTNQKIAANLVFITTLISLITIPFLAYLNKITY